MWSKNGRIVERDPKKIHMIKYYFDFQHLYQQDTCFRVPYKGGN